MQDISLPCNKAKPSLLLIEAETQGYSERATQLTRSPFCVTRAGNLRDVYLLRSVFHFSVAVLSDVIGSHALRASAQMVRGQWPKARILLLGKAPSQFDDHLYDETVVHTSNESTLLAMIGKVSEDPWNQRGDALAAWRDHVSAIQSPEQSWTTQERDPIRVSEPVSEIDVAKDWPGKKRLRRAVR